MSGGLTEPHVIYKYWIPERKPGVRAPCNFAWALYRAIYPIPSLRGDKTGYSVLFDLEFGIVRMSLSRMVLSRAYASAALTRNYWAYSNISSFTKPNSAPAPALISPLFRVARNYSADSQVKETHVTVPIPMYGVAGNYASALYVSAVKANILDRVESELKTLMEAYNNSPSFRNFIKDLSVPRDTRLKAVQEIFEESSFSDITKNFLAVAADLGRLRQLESIANAFTRLTLAHKGEVHAVVTTVIPLPAEEEKELKQVLGKILGAGKTVKFEEKIDPSILGGLIIDFEDKRFDISIKTRVAKMERLLNEPVDFLNL